MSVRDVSFPIQAPDLKDSASAKAIAERQAAWKADMPEDEDALWDWLTSLDDASRMALLAHCVSHGVNALYEKADRYGAGVSASGVSDASRKPTGSRARCRSTWSRRAGVPRSRTISAGSPKARILEAVREARGEQSAQLIDHLKKADMAKEAERMLEGPAGCRNRSALVSADASPARSRARARPLPEFLAGEERDRTAPATMPR